MRRRKLSELFAEVDPELKVINESNYPRQHNRQAIRLDEKPATEAYHYQPRTSTDDDRERAAITCPVCRQPTARLLPYGFLAKRKACPECIDRRARLLEYKARLFEARRRRRQPGAGWACAGYTNLPQAKIQVSSLVASLGAVVGRGIPIIVPMGSVILPCFSPP